MRLVIAIALGLLLPAACGPGPQRDEPDAPPICTPEPEACGDQLDNDCDQLTDCRDPDCSGVGDCPVCGQVQHPLGSPFALPAGVDGGGPTGSYERTLTFTGFPPSLTFQKPTDLISVCVNIEHSWLRDLQIELVAPSQQVVVLQEFLGQTGSEIFLGMPNDADDVDPEPGFGDGYCWTPVSLRPPMLVYANQVNPAGHVDLPAGNYASAKPMAGLVGTPLNGDWMLRVTDLWGNDNGYIFAWAVAFDPTLVQDCSMPPIQ